MTFFFTLLVAGLSVGSIYALIAITLNLTFWTTKTVNFGQGAVLMLSAMSTVFIAKAGYPLWLAVIAAVLLSGVIMVVLERCCVRPALKISGSMGWAVSTLGFGVVIQGIVSKYLGTQAVAFPDVMARPDLFVQVGGIRIGVQYLIVFGFSLGIIVLMNLVLKHTIVGRVIRGVAQDRELASVFGIPVNLVILGSFVLSGALAGMAGILTAQIVGTVDPAFGFSLLLSGFVAGIVGGFGKNWGALAGGLFIGTTEQLVGGYISTAAGHGISLAILLVMLAIRPQGMFGREEAVKV